MTISEDNLELQLRTNNGLQANIWDAVRKEATLRSLDLGSLSIKEQNGEVYLDGYLKEENQPLVENTIHSVVGVVEVHNHLRTNDLILADIWDALWKEDTIRSLDLGSLSVNVKDGEVHLTGNLARENDLTLIEGITHSVAGVVAVHNHLVTDCDLIIQVAQALVRDERTRAFILPVGVSHGWINLGGEVPTRELQHVAEKVAAGVSCVRGVITLPRVTGESPNIPRRAVQPRNGAVVYGKVGDVGVITQVVIQPDDQLVTHIVVRSKEHSDGDIVARENKNIVPLEAIDLVNRDSIFLRRNAPTLKAYPAFNPDEYLLAPSTWNAPFPYCAGEVLWSLRDILEAGSRPWVRPEIKPQEASKEAPNRVMAQAGA